MSADEPVARKGLSAGDGQEDREANETLGHQTQHFLCGWIGPLQVLDQQNKRLLHCSTCNELDETV
jgi:hypothetical protein